ncbi:MAG TPA: SRPBCC domain-containing protein [Terriglobales bacterium]|nr:SRPBCC domain-containing protein [Terriglobales bacterium]
MTTAPVSLSDNALTIEQEIRVQAALDITFAALLEQLGPAFATPEGVSLQAKIEPWPGGRWYRDLGGNNGHLWAHVQSIKRPTLLEFSGPLMMSQAVINSVQYRLSEERGATLIKFHHYAFGALQPEFRTGMPKGWTLLLEQTKARAERSGGK